MGWAGNSSLKRVTVVVVVVVVVFVVVAWMCRTNQDKTRYTGALC